jgi:hypothetical protein
MSVDSAGARAPIHGQPVTMRAHFTKEAAVNNRPSFHFVLLSIMIALPALAAADPHPQTREGWLVGFGVGGGSAAISADGSSSDRQGGAAASFRVGYAFQPELSAELNSNGWSKEDAGLTTTFTVTTAAINYYPGAQGVVLRGGVGFGSTSISAKSGGTTVTASESGLGLLVGAAYEFRLGRTFALGPQVEYSYMTLSDFNANYVNLCLGFNWYFIPK